MAGTPRKGPARKSPREGIASRVVFFVVAIGIVLGAVQYLTGGVKVGDDGWFRTTSTQLGELFNRGSDAAQDKLEKATDGAGAEIGEQLRSQFNSTTTVPVPAAGGDGQ